jgi:hypothetical protein
MSRITLAALLAALLALPTAAAPVEVIRVEAPPSALTAPMAMSGAITATTIAPLTATSVSVSYSAPAALTGLFAPSVHAAPVALPTAAPAPAAALAVSPHAAPAVAAAGPQNYQYGPEARGPPAAPRTLSRAALTVAQTVRSWGAPVEAIFDKHDVLLVGENHGSLDSVQTLTREMPRLAAAGVKAVGIEGLKRPNQEAVDAWLQGRTLVFPESALDFSPARRQVFRDLLLAARRDGVRVVALGLPLAQWAEAAATLAAKNTGRPVTDFPNEVNAHFELAGSEYIEGYNEAVAEVFLTRRNEAMAGFIADALKGGGKAVVLVGQAHVEGLDMVPGRLMNAPGDWGTLAKTLTGYALKAFSLTQTGGVFVNADAAQLDRAARPKSYRLASDETPEGAPRFIPLGPDRGLWHAGGRVPGPRSALTH